MRINIKVVIDVYVIESGPTSSLTLWFVSLSLYTIVQFKSKCQAWHAFDLYGGVQGEKKNHKNIKQVLLFYCDLLMLYLHNLHYRNVTCTPKAFV